MSDTMPRTASTPAIVGDPTDDESARLRQRRLELLQRRLAGAAATTTEAQPIPQLAADAPTTLSAGQRQMWFLNRLDPDSPEYLVPTVLRLRGELHERALRRAVARVASRHRVLRTRYTLVDGEPTAVYDDRAPIPFAVNVAGGGLTEGLRLAAAATTRPIDLERELPIRVELIRLAADDHLLVLVVHHIATDQVAQELIVAEIGAQYQGIVAHRANPASTTPVQYGDFVAWQNDRLAAGQGTRELDYWTNRLADVPQLALPLSRPRTAVRSWHGDAVDFVLDAPTTTRLRTLARARSASVFTVLLAALQAVLSRYSGQSDVAVGTVVSTRTRDELADMVGYAINTLVIRTRWSGSPSFADLVAVTRDDTLAAFDRREVPFERLVDALAPERDLSVTPLFQVALTMHDLEATAPAFGALAVERVALPTTIAKFDLGLQVAETAEGTLAGRLEYATALFGSSAADRIARHIKRFVELATSDPTMPIDQIAMLDDAETDEVLEHSAGERRQLPADLTLVSLFESRAATDPEAEALIVDDQTYSYAELNVRANRLAHHLIAGGAGPGTRIGVALPRSLNLLVSLYAVIKTGAAYVPLDLGYPRERIAYMVEDAAPRYVLSTTEAAESLPESAPLLRLDELDLTGYPAENPTDADRVTALTPGDAAYVIYTSGSTGRPKGVVVPHSGIVNRLLWMQHEYALTSADRVLQKTPASFDVSVWEFFWPLQTGAALVVAEPEGHRDPAYLARVIRGAAVTVLHFVPSMLAGFITEPGVADCTSLRHVVCSGEALPRDLARRFAELLPHASLHNLYGPTEASVDVTSWRFDGATGVTSGVPIGRPVWNTRTYVLDDALGLVPPGGRGELYLAGPQLATGYLGKSALTGQRFLPNPYGQSGERMYRTGDMVVRRLDGVLEYVGRLDDQVKIRGLRIELGEIAAALGTYPGVSQAVADVHQDTSTTAKHIVGYVVAVPGGDEVDPEAVRAFVGLSLPEYMVPSAVMVLEALPLTVNGKLDRRALPAPDFSARAVSRDAASESEARVAEVWRDVLGVTRVGMDDNFFDLGGDSIRAVALVGALRGVGVDVSVRDVFEHRTVARLVAGLPDSADASSRPAPVERFALVPETDRHRIPEWVSAGVVDVYPLSRVQTGMAVEMLAGGGEFLYHNVTSFRVRDAAAFDEAALREALDVVAGRHEVLRTSLDLSGCSIPVQVVHGTARIPLGIVDLTRLSAEDQHTELLGFQRAERSDPFDVYRAPLFRVHAHVTSGDDWWISLTECHVILEGWSHHSLLMEILALYRQLREGAEIVAPEEPGVRFADFVAAELVALESAEDRAYWRGVIEDRARVALPGAWRDTTTRAAERYRLVVDYSDLDSGLRDLASSAGVSLKSVLLAAHLKVMSMLTEDRSFFTGLVCDGRPEAAGADRVLGMYLNTLPFAYERTARTWFELVGQVYRQTVELWPHRRFPMPTIQRELAGGQRLIDVMFNYQDFHQVDYSVIDGYGVIDDSPNEFALAVTTLGNRVKLSSRTDVMSRADADRLAGMYRAVLVSMAGDHQGDAQAAYLPEGERELLLGFGTGKSDGPSRTLVELFGQQARRTPDAVAVGDGGTRLTYRQLDERANRLARYLIERGAGPESLIAVCRDRDTELVVTLLAILKSGAGYLPIDPGYPTERIAYMLNDARVSLLLTDGRRPAHHELADAIVTDTLNLNQYPSTAPAITPRPDNLAYVIYTSGSTGNPKGVQITHANVCRLFTATAATVRPTEDDVWTLFHSYAFDFSVWELWGPLLHGGRLVVVPWSVARSADDFLDLLVRERVTVLSQTPSAFLRLVSAARDVGDARIDRLALRTVVFGGERLDLAELDPWVRRLGLDRIALVNMYGITETTVHVTEHRLSLADLAGDASPVGRPLADLRVHLLDPAGALVPIGVPGEIHVAGAGLARGYLNRPAVTAARFVPDPFGAAGERLYRSGDLAVRLHDGSLHYLGRLDDQVKIRGYRIELGEIQAALLADPSVRDAAVLAVEGRLVAYVVPVDAGGLDVDELRAFAGLSLPDYMVPSAVVALEALPLTVNGKLDRRALPAPDFSARAVSRDAASDAEVLVARVWQDVLGVARVGVDDNFFDLGGDSIRAVELVGALRGVGVEVSVRDVFEYRTVAKLVDGLPQLAGSSHGVAAVDHFALVPEADRGRMPEWVSAGAVDAYPLSRVQAGMAVEMLAGGGEFLYHNVTSFRVRDAAVFDEAALRGALDVVAARHEVLRTSVSLSGCSVPMQVVHGMTLIPLAVHDFGGLSAEDQRAELVAFQREERSDPFDMSRAPLLRVHAHVTSDDAWWITLTESHVILEGWSHHSLLMELLAVYRRLRDGAEVVEPTPAAVRFADYVAAELVALDSAEDRSYWRKVIEDRARFALPAAWRDTESKRERFQTVLEYGDLEDGLRSLASLAGVSFKSVMLAAHLKVMSMLTEESSFFTGLVCDGRPEAAGAERVLGMYLNTVPFAYERSARTWFELVGQVFQQTVELWPHRRFPMPAMQRELAGGQRLIDVMFNYLDFHQADESGMFDPDAQIGETPNEFALSTIATRGIVVIDTSTELVSRADAERLAGMYRAVLVSMAGDHQGDAQAAYLPKGERELLLEEWNTTPTSTSRTLVALFAEQARRTPDTVAVGDGVTRLTYRQLDQRANRLAQYLIERGAGPESLIGVCRDRDTELVVTLLAILKAGAGYLPIDPGYPIERIAYMLGDAGVSLLLTDGRRPAHHELTSAVVTDTLDLTRYPASAPAKEPLPDNLAYVIYTSGSTGNPKGVQITHRGLANYLTYCAQAYVSPGHGGVPLHSSTAFDLAVTSIYVPLITGRTVHVLPDGLDPALLASVLAAVGPSAFIKMTPAHLRLINETTPDAPLLDHDGSMVVGGEALPWRLAETWLATAPEGACIVNEYGPTEITVANAVYVTDHVSGTGDMPIGTPIAGTTMYVLDATMQPVPIGVLGEIFVGGVGVARGYRNRPGLTAQRFVPDPYGRAGDRLYRTGDIGFFDAAGNVTYVGRSDTQVKIRGYRIELGEIEAALDTHPDVANSAVSAHEQPGGTGKHLVAHVAARPGTTVTADALRDHLRRRMPEYMVPSAVVVLDALPLTANGKLDRAALPAPERDTVQDRRAPRTPRELMLCELIRDVLDLPEVGLDENLVELGLDSLTATRLIGRIRTVFNAELTVRDVLEARTAGNLVGRLETAARPRPALRPRRRNEHDS